MLSTSQKKLANQYLLTALPILVLLLALMAPRWEAIPTFSAERELTRLSAADISAYRWQAMAKFYSTYQGNIPAAGVDLTALSAADVSAYRWQAMAKFYSTQQGNIPVTGGDLSTLSAADISAYRWRAMAEFYAKQAQANIRYGSPGR